MIRLEVGTLGKLLIRLIVSSSCSKNTFIHTFAFIINYSGFRIDSFFTEIGL